MFNFYKIDSSPVFKRVVIDFNIEGLSTIYWELKPSFKDVLPYQYYIDFNPEFNNPDEWITIAGPLVNATSYSFSNIRTPGRIRTFGFKIRLETPANSYESEVYSNQGLLTYKQQVQYKTITRRVSMVLIPIKAKLLKRKWFGPRCGRCINSETGEVTDSHCTTCYGTGYVGGYWKAADIRLLDISTASYTDRLDPSLVAGQTGHQIVKAATVGIPFAEAYDVIVREDVDRRYYVRQTSTRAEMAGIPVITDLDMGVADFDDIIYSFPVE
jgi:hypothetical protein